MSYKLLEITTLYEGFVKSFYSENPLCSSLPYKEQFDRLISECFGGSNFLQLELAKIGVESEIVFYNVENLQRSWGYTCRNLNLFEILLEQVRFESPDCILIDNLFIFSIEQLHAIKDAATHKCKFVSFHFSALSESVKNSLFFFDEVYTGNKFMLEQLKPLCRSIKLLYHAFNPKILERLDVKDVKNDLLFSGSIMIGYHTNRLEMLSRIIDSHIPYTFYGDIYGSLLAFGNLKSIRSTVKNILSVDSSSRKLKNTEKQLRKFDKQGLFGISYYNLIASHLICLNQHTPVAGTGSGNMRMFEATGCGACLMTDYKEENTDLFIPDEEIVVYRSYDELVEKARWLLDNPDKAKEIALEGQHRTLATHTYKQKAEVLNNYISILLRS